MFDLALADYRLADAAHVRLPESRTKCHGDFERDFAAGMNLGRDIDVYANVKVLKLGVDQRVDAYAADAWLKRPESHRNVVADLERCLLSIDCADLRVLDQLGVAVAKQRCGGRGWNRDRESVAFDFPAGSG